jgi:hypothetical protein
MCPGQDLDRLHQRRIPSHLAVVVTVGADQIGQHLGIATVRFGPRTPMPISVATHRPRVERIHLIAGTHQRTDQQPPVGLDPNHHPPRILDMGGDQRVQLTHPRQPISDPPGREHAAVLVQQAQVMVGLAPVHTDKQHPGPPLHRPPGCEPEKDLRRPNGSAQLARHPTSRPPFSTPAGARSPPRAPRPPSLRVLTDQRLRHSLTHPRLVRPIRGLPPDPPPPRATPGSALRTVGAARGWQRCQQSVTTAQADSSSSVADGS